MKKTKADPRAVPRKGHGQFIYIGLGVLLLIYLGMLETAAVHIVEEPAQVLVEDTGDIGTVAAAVLGQFAQGKVAVQICLFLFHPVTDKVQDLFLALLGQAFHLQRGFLLIGRQLLLHALYLYRPVGRKGSQQDDDGDDRQHEQAQGHSQDIAVERGTPAHDKMKERNVNQGFGILLRKIVRIGETLFGETAQLPDDHTEGQDQPQQVYQGKGAAEDKISVKETTLHLRSGQKGTDQGDERHHGISAGQDVNGLAPPGHFENPAEIAENERRTQEWGRQDERHAYLQDGIGFPGEKDGRKKGKVGQGAQSQRTPTGIVIVQVLVVRCALMSPANHAHNHADGHIDRQRDAEEQFLKGIGHIGHKYRKMCPKIKMGSNGVLPGIRPGGLPGPSGRPDRTSPREQWPCGHSSPTGPPKS